ncbi:M30 family zinc metallopeptidase [Cupriavidus sp. H39]
MGSFPAARRPVSGTYAEAVTVPPGTTLSVVVR